MQYKFTTDLKVQYGIHLHCFSVAIPRLDMNLIDRNALKNDKNGDVKEKRLSTKQNARFECLPDGCCTNRCNAFIRQENPSKHFDSNFWVQLKKG